MYVFSHNLKRIFRFMEICGHFNGSGDATRLLSDGVL